MFNNTAEINPASHALWEKPKNKVVIIKEETVNLPILAFLQFLLINILARNDLVKSSSINGAIIRNPINLKIRDNVEVGSKLIWNRGIMLYVKSHATAIIMPVMVAIISILNFNLYSFQNTASKIPTMITLII